MLKIVVTFALPSEFASWRRLSRFEALSEQGMPIYFARIGDAEVYAAITGIGARSVQNELHDLLAGCADFCIASGLGGSLRKAYPAGAILVAKTVRATADEEVRTDDSLVQSAVDCGATAADSFFTSDVVVNSPAEKLRLGEIAGVVDMESLHIVRRARQCGVPCVAIRAISDAVETRMPLDFNRVIDDRGQMPWIPTLFEVAKAPRKFPEMIRFGLNSSRAARNLAHFLDDYIRVLAGAGDSRFSVARAETK